MRNLDLDSLQIFKAVVDYGGITNAAAQLNRVQSNITTRVKNLEERLGVALFHRNGGRVVV
ncbi:helix-turn-helix domain-containing protein [Pseudomonas plecoglossicida]|uniref:helix-turn-helix domain-containing protein n=1 Tax=Pseudomonas plecoglossicida TaxID=70775 RepID=UPI0009DEE638|nr:LysR family transcriptional regulator [Pseudomonas plecoglossicida]